MVINIKAIYICVNEEFRAPVVIGLSMTSCVDHDARDQSPDAPGLDLDMRARSARACDYVKNICS